MKQNDTPPPFNRVLKTLRKRLKLTQGEFAHKAGVSPSTIYSYEAGRMRLSEDTFRQIKAVLIQCLADAAQAETLERQRKLAPFAQLSGQIATTDPEMSSALEDYCVGVGGARRE